MMFVPERYTFKYRSSPPGIPRTQRHQAIGLFGVVNEGRDQIADGITRDVMSALERRLPEYRSTGKLEIIASYPPSSSISSFIDTAVLDITYNPNARRWPWVRGMFYVNTDVSPDQRYIVITVDSSKKDLTSEDLALLSYYISVDYRHELEHERQYSEGRLPDAIEVNRGLKWTKDKRLDFSDPNNVIKYLTAPHEIEAYIAAFNYGANKRGISLKEILDEKFADLRDSLRYRNVNESEIERVVRTIRPIWDEYKYIPAPNRASIKDVIDSIESDYVKLIDNFEKLTPESVILEFEKIQTIGSSIENAARSYPDLDRRLFNMRANVDQALRGVVSALSRDAYNDMVKSSVLDRLTLISPALTKKTLDRYLPYIEIYPSVYTFSLPGGLQLGVPVDKQYDGTLWKYFQSRLEVMRQVLERWPEATAVLPVSMEVFILRQAIEKAGPSEHWKSSSITNILESPKIRDFPPKFIESGKLLRYTPPPKPPRGIVGLSDMDSESQEQFESFLERAINGLVTSSTYLEQSRIRSKIYKAVMAYNLLNSNKISKEDFFALLAEEGRELPVSPWPYVLGVSALILALYFTLKNN